MDKIEPIMNIRKEVRFPHRESPSSFDSKDESFENSMSQYVEIAKSSPIDKDALEILLKLEVGNEMAVLLKSCYK